MKIINQNLNFNKPQLNFLLNLNNIRSTCTNIWGRATGKSFIIAWLMHSIIRKAPRSSWFIAGATFRQLLAVTLPSTISGLETLGYRRNVHYFLGEPPPKKYLLPYQAPLDFKHYLTFVRQGDPDNRTVGFHLVSMDKSATSPRGLNTDGGIVDERLLIEPESFRQSIGATNRGNLEHFKHVPYHHSVFDFSSMPLTSEGNYLLERANYYDIDNYDFVGIRNQLITLQLEFLRNKDVAFRKAIWEDIRKLQKKLQFYVGKSGQFYSEYNVFDNIRHVGLKYIEDQFAEMTELMFSIEMLNKREKKIEGGFYQTFDRNIHSYKGHWDYEYLDSLNYNFSAIKKRNSKEDKDCYSNLPLNITADFGGKINCIIAFQHLKSLNQVNFLKNFYAKHPKILDNAYKDFCEYYKPQQNRLLNFWYDPYGNSKTGNTQKSNAEQAMDILRKGGFEVIPKSVGEHNKKHNSKYNLMNKIFAEDMYPRYPRFRFNQYNCKETIISIEQTKILEKDGIVKKDKRNEAKDNIDQSETTHFSDALDIASWDLFSPALGSGKVHIPILLK